MRYGRFWQFCNIVRKKGSNKWKKKKLRTRLAIPGTSEMNFRFHPPMKNYIWQTFVHGGEGLVRTFFLLNLPSLHGNRGSTLLLALDSIIWGKKGHVLESGQRCNGMFLLRKKDEEAISFSFKPYWCEAHVNALSLLDIILSCDLSFLTSRTMCTWTRTIIEWIGYLGAVCYFSLALLFVFKT